MAISAVPYEHQNAPPVGEQFKQYGSTPFPYAPYSEIIAGTAEQTEVQNPELIKRPYGQNQVMNDVVKMINQQDFVGALELIESTAHLDFSDENFKALGQYASEAIQSLINEGDYAEASHYITELSAGGLKITTPDVFGPAVTHYHDMLDAGSMTGPSAKAAADRAEWKQSLRYQLEQEELQKKYGYTLNL